MPSGPETLPVLAYRTLSQRAEHVARLEAYLRQKGRVVLLEDVFQAAVVLSQEVDRFDTFMNLLNTNQRRKIKIWGRD